MAISKASRQAIFNQLIKANPAAKEQVEQLLDDSNPLAQQFENMFMARSDYSREMNNLQTERAKIGEGAAANQSWRTTQEAHMQNVIRQAQAQVAQAQAMAKVAVDKLTGALTKAQSGDTLYPQDLMVDSSLTAFAQTAQGTPPLPAANPALGGFDKPSAAFEQQRQQESLNPDEFIGKMTSAIVGEIGALEGLRYQHYELFGAPLDAQYLITTAQKTGRPITEIYNETYNPEARRAELEQSKFQTAVQAAVDEKLKTLAATADPSGKASSLAALGMLTGQNSEHRSIALESSGPEWTAAKLDPSFAARQGLPGQGAGTPPAPGAPPAHKNFMDSFSEWEADMMAGAMEGRGNAPNVKLI